MFFWGLRLGSGKGVGLGGVQLFGLSLKVAIGCVPAKPLLDELMNKLISDL